MLGKVCAIGLVLALGACGSGDAGKMKKVKDDICACKDMDCVKKVEKDNEDLKKSMMEKFKDAKGPEDLPKDLVEIVEEMDQCRRKIRKEERENKKGDVKAEARGDAKADAKAEGGDGSREMVAKMRGFRDKACACADAACAQAVGLEMAEASNKWAANSKGLDEVVTKQLGDLAKEYADCVVKVSTK
ncbi:MAG: hypothetical protein KF773_13690 [Deltaproteobacteria bacterium]|nr:hypothetical protein [Deltaproteobacteria bacterium]